MSEDVPITSLDDAVGQLGVDLIERVPRTARSVRRRRAFGAGVALMGLTGLSIAAATGGSTPSVKPGLTKPSVPVPHLAAPAPLSRPSLPADRPAGSPPTAPTTIAAPGPTGAAPVPPAKGPAAWRVAYLLHGPTDTAEVRDGTGHLVHAFTSDHQAQGDFFLDQVALTPDGSILVYTVNGDGFDAVRVRRSDGSPDPALDQAAVGPASCGCVQAVVGGSQGYISSLAASPDDRHVATIDQYGLSVVTIGHKSQQTVVTLARPPARDSDGDGADLATWSPDGRLLAFSTLEIGLRPGRGGPILAQDSLYVWDQATDALSLVDKGSSPTDIAWSRSGELAWLTLAGTTKVRSGTASRTLATAPRFNSSQQNGTLSWSPDGRRIAVSTDLLRLVTVSSGASTVVPQRGPDSKVLWLPDGNVLVTGFNSMNVPADTILGGPLVFDDKGHLLRQFPWGKTNPDWDFSFGSPRS